MDSNILHLVQKMILQYNTDMKTFSYMFFYKSFHGHQYLFSRPENSKNGVSCGRFSTWIMFDTSFFPYSTYGITCPYLKDTGKWGLIMHPGRKGNVIFEDLASLFFWWTFQCFPHIGCIHPFLKEDKPNPIQSLHILKSQIFISPIGSDMDPPDSITYELKR